MASGQQCPEVAEAAKSPDLNPTSQSFRRFAEENRKDFNVQTYKAIQIRPYEG